MESLKAHNSSIFSFDDWLRLTDSYRRERTGRRAPSVIVFLIGFFLTMLVAVIRPERLFLGEVSINASIRATHDPLEPPEEGGVYDTTHDGLHHLVADPPASATLLMMGDSTSRWHRYPVWIEKKSIEKGNRIAVLNGCVDGYQPFQMADSLAYILERNGRRFDAVLIKGGMGFSFNMLVPPEEAYPHAPIGVGALLLFSGRPKGATRTSYSHHYIATARKRRKDWYLLEKNERMRWFMEVTKPSEDVELTTYVPPEMKPRVERMLRTFEEILLAIIERCREHGTRPVFLTNGQRVYYPNEPISQELKFTYQSYKGEYSLLCMDHLFVEMLNEVIRRVGNAEEVQVIDYAEFIKTLIPPGGTYNDLFVDISHLVPKYEEPVGEFVLEELLKAGL